MSTIYGSVKSSDGTKWDIEAFGVSGRVKLVPNGDYERAIIFDSETECEALISLLTICSGHCWPASP